MITFDTEEAGTLEFNGRTWRARDARGASAVERLNRDEWENYLTEELADAGPHATAGHLLSRDLRNMGLTVERWQGGLDGEEPGGEDALEDATGEGEA